MVHCLWVWDDEWHSINKSATIIYTTMKCGDVTPADQLNLFMRLIQAMKKYDDFHSIYIYQVVLSDIINLMMLPIYSEIYFKWHSVTNSKGLQFLREGMFDLHNYIARYNHYTTTVSYTLVLIRHFVHGLWMKDSCTKRWWFQEASYQFLGG